jgi:hypothetical protein
VSSKQDAAVIATEMLKSGRKTIPADIAEAIVLEIWRSRRQVFAVCNGLSRVICDAKTEALNLTLADVPTGRTSGASFPSGGREVIRRNARS